MVDKRRILLYAVVAAGVILVGYGLVRATTSLRLPGKLDADLPNAVIVLALGAFLYDRKLRGDEAAARKAAEAAKAKLAAPEGAEAGAEAAKAEAEALD